MNSPVGNRSMADARLARRVMLANARDEMEASILAAEKLAARRVQDAERVFNLERGRFHKTAVIRAGIWRRFRSLPDVEIRGELLLRAYDAEEAQGAAEVAVSLWYARMLSNEMRRRQAARFSGGQQPRRVPSWYPGRPDMAVRNPVVYRPEVVA